MRNFVILCCMIVFFSPLFAHADTYVYTGSGGTIIANVSLDKSVYTPGEDMQISGSLSSTYSTLKQVSLTAQTDTNALTTLISAQNISPGGTIIGSPNPVHFTAPTSPGEYTADFVTGVQEGGWQYTPYYFPYAVETNETPFVNAGSDKSITLPTSSTSVTGAAYDPDGTIESSIWSKVSGPGTPTIENPSSYTTTISGFTTAGTYVFRLTVTDDRGATAHDEMQVIVSAVNAPDLISSTTNPTVAVEGEQNTFSANIANSGLSSTGTGFTTLFQFDSDTNHATVDATQIASTAVLAAGATTSASVTYTFPSAGMWYARACADNDASFTSAIAESNEGNNCSSSWTLVWVRPEGDPFMHLIATPYGVVTGGSSTLSITATNFATSITCTIDQGVGTVPMTATGASSWSGSKVVSNITETTTYTAVCTGPSGSDNGSVIVYADEGSLPGASLVADPETIARGESSNLIWWSTNTTSCTGINFDTNGATWGNITVSPTVTTPYNIICTGPTGTFADSPETITVIGEGGGGGGGDPQCSDGLDNDDPEDTLVDDEDPGCHSDGDVTNSASYIPSDNQESNRRRPIFIDY